MKGATIWGPSQEASEEPTNDIRVHFIQLSSIRKSKLFSNNTSQIKIFCSTIPLLYMHYNPEKVNNSI